MILISYSLVKIKFILISNFSYLRVVNRILFKCFYTHINEEKYDFQKMLLKLLRKDRIENKDLIENEKRELCTNIRQKVSNESF